MRFFTFTRRSSSRALRACFSQRGRRILSYSMVVVQFSVDLAQESMAPSDVIYLQSTFNGWCGSCAPMARLSPSSDVCGVRHPSTRREPPARQDAAGVAQPRAVELAAGVAYAEGRLRRGGHQHADGAGLPPDGLANLGHRHTEILYNPTGAVPTPPPPSPTPSTRR